MLWPLDQLLPSFNGANTHCGHKFCAFSLSFKEVLESMARAQPKLQQAMSCKLMQKKKYFFLNRRFSSNAQCKCAINARVDAFALIMHRCCMPPTPATCRLSLIIAPNKCLSMILMNCYCCSESN